MISCPFHKKIKMQKFSTIPNQQLRRIHIDFYQNRILEKYSSKDQNPVTLRQLTMFGRSFGIEKLLRSANYIREELPVRLAHRIRCFQQLPFVVGANPNIEKVYSLYWNAFEQFRTYPVITTEEENRQFCELVQANLDNHKVVIPKIVMGVYESQKYMEDQDLNIFINETLQSRVSRRVLAEQHLALSEGFNGVKPKPNMIGIVNTACKASEIVKNCASLSSSLFSKAFQVPPPQVIVDGDLNAKFTYIPDHIEYIIFELLKNSMKYTYRSKKNTALLPSIKVTIGMAENQVMFRVSDEGIAFDLFQVAGFQMNFYRIYGIL
jgi:pyruvate dehydrogenase kinase 2/3/4